MTTTTHIAPVHAARMLSRAGIYHLNATCLQTLCELAAGSGSLTMTSLARKIGLTTSAFTGTADCLEAADFVARQPSRSDRRVTWLNLTERGRAALQDILDA